MRGHRMMGTAPLNNGMAPAAPATVNAALPMLRLGGNPSSVEEQNQILNRVMSMSNREISDLGEQERSFVLQIKQLMQGGADRRGGGSDAGFVNL